MLAFAGLRATTTIQGNAFALLPAAIGLLSDGVFGVPVVRSAGNRGFSAAPAGLDLALRQAAPATDPDLSYATAFGHP